MNRGRGRGTSTGLIQCLELNDGCARGNTFFTINRRSNYRISRCNYRLFILFLWNFWTRRVTVKTEGQAAVPSVPLRLIYVRRQLLLRVSVTNTASPGFVVVLQTEGENRSPRLPHSTVRVASRPRSPSLRPSFVL